MFTALGVPMICTPIVCNFLTNNVYVLNCCVVWWIKCSCRQKRYLLRLHKFLASGNMFLSIGCKWYTHIIHTRGNTSLSDRFSWYRQDSLCIGLWALPRSCYQCQSHPDPNTDQIVNAHENCTTMALMIKFGLLLMLCHLRINHNFNQNSFRRACEVKCIHLKSRI